MIVVFFLSRNEEEEGEEDRKKMVSLIRDMAHVKWFKCLTTTIPSTTAIETRILADSNMALPAHSNTVFDENPHIKWIFFMSDQCENGLLEQIDFWISDEKSITLIENEMTLFERLNVYWSNGLCIGRARQCQIARRPKIDWKFITCIRIATSHFMRLDFPMHFGVWETETQSHTQTQLHARTHTAQTKRIVWTHKHSIFVRIETVSRTKRKKMSMKSTNRAIDWNHFECEKQLFQMLLTYNPG